LTYRSGDHTAAARGLGVALERFPPGAQIELREVWNGRTWEVRQAIVVRDSPEVIALYTPPRSPAQVAAGASGRRLRLPEAGWRLEEARTWERPVLGLHVPGKEHSVLLMWDASWRLLHWYINLESGLRRTQAGFEYEDHVLDAVMEPDFSSWRWKDEDELAEAVARGLFTQAQADGFREEGRRAAGWLRARRPPYDEPWEEWRPQDGG
jgi:hypothetical protein